MNQKQGWTGRTGWILIICLCLVIPVRFVEGSMRIVRFTLLFMLLSMTGVSVFAGQKPFRSDDASGAGEMTFSYKYEGPRFYLSLIEIDLGSDGSGELRFKRGESDEVLDSKIKLLPATVARIKGLFEVSGFLTSETEYQSKKDFSNLGWITLQARRGSSERKARFNYTANVQIEELASIFRGIATQEISLFDIDNAQQYQPLDLPKQLEMLENDLRLQRITEPERLLTPLKEIAGDDTQPLIARNQAKRIVEAIKKGKFKSTIKK